MIQRLPSAVAGSRRERDLQRPIAVQRLLPDRRAVRPEPCLQQMEIDGKQPLLPEAPGHGDRNRAARNCGFGPATFVDGHQEAAGACQCRQLIDRAHRAEWQGDRGESVEARTVAVEDRPQAGAEFGVDRSPGIGVVGMPCREQVEVRLVQLAVVHREQALIKPAPRVTSEDDNRIGGRPCGQVDAWIPVQGHQHAAPDRVTQVG